MRLPRATALLFHRRYEREPACQVVIAKAAGAIFYVGLEVKNSFSKFAISSARQIGKPLDDEPGFARK